MQSLSIFLPVDTNPTTIIFMALGGLGIFLFGLNIMSGSMKSLAGERLKLLIKKTTDTTFKAILVGTVITCLIQSSSATTVIVVGLICAGLMNLTQAVGVMLGANIGTTITAFIIGLDIADYALPIIFIGSILVVFINRRKINISGMAIMGFGMLFLGLEFMGVSLKQVSTLPFFENMITTLSDHWALSLFTSTVLTALIQSSSAFIGILQKLYSTGAIPLVAAIPMIYGANIGTTVTALIASASGNRESKQAAFANLLFKSIGVVIFLILLKPITSLSTIVANSIGPNNSLVLAIIHTIFNITTTIVIGLLLKPLTKLIKKVIPDKAKSSSSISAYNLNVELLETSPILALTSAKKCICDMSNLVLEMFSLTKKYFNSKDETSFNEVMALEDDVDMYDHLIHDYIMQLHTEHLNTSESIKQAIYLDTIRDFERIADHATNLAEFYKDRFDSGVKTSIELLKMLNDFIDVIATQIQTSCQAFETKDHALAEKVIVTENNVDDMEKKYRKAQLLLIQKEIMDTNDIHYVDILSNLERISDHCCNIAENIIDPYYMRRN